MRTVILGATGFLGSYLVRDLLANGHHVLAVMRRDSDTRRLAGVLDRVELAHGSLDDVAALAPALARFAPDALVHMAWQGVANIDRNSPRQAANLVSTVELAAFAAALGIANFIGAGSQAEYGPVPHAIRETDPTAPTTLYGMAKLAAGRMAGKICMDHGVRFAWLRIFSTYGPMDNGGWLIPSMIAKLRRGEAMLLTACEQRWSFLHARDAAAAFRMVVERKDADGIFNLGHPEAPPLAQTVGRLRDLVAPGAELGFGRIPYRPDQVMVLQPDIARLRGLGWEPSVSLEQGLRETVEWHVRTDD